MVIGLLTISLSLPEARSLKDKRSVLRSIKDRTVARMNMSVAEVGCQDTHRRAELAFVTVAARKAVAERRLADVQRSLAPGRGFVLLDSTTEFL